MAPYDDWNKIDDEEDEELQDAAFFDGRRDVILFAVDCASSMLASRPDPAYDDEVQTSHLLSALDAAVQIQKKKVVVGPNDSVGILLFNTTRRGEGKGQGADIKKGTFVYQPVGPISAPRIQELMQLVDAAREDPAFLEREFPPVADDARIPMGDVFTSCNWVLRDGAPKTASKRVFLVTDADDPHAHAGPGARAERLRVSAQTTLVDLTQAGASVEPFFISTDAHPFDVGKFYSSVLLPSALPSAADDDADPALLPPELSITRVADLLAQMRFREAPKRALFGVPFALAPGLVLGVKGYGLVTEQKKGAYAYFVDLGDRMEIAKSRTVYVDEEREAEVDKGAILFGMALGETAGAAFKGDEDEGGGGGAAASGAGTGGGAVRRVARGSKVFYTPEEVRAFRTMGLEPGLRLLGFKDRAELAFEDNVKHSHFIYPDETTYAGSRRTFAALLRTMVAKNKIGLVLALVRRNASPVFCALLPQAEKAEDGGWNEPPGFHLIPLPFADDIRAAPIEEAYRAPDAVKAAARAWVDKLCVKTGAYPPDAYPNPALAFHHAQLQASAFREEYDAEAFEDATEPKVDMMHKRAGTLLAAWKEAVQADEHADTVVIQTSGTKRKADVTVDEAEIRAKYEQGALGKLRVDQLKEFLKSKSQPVSGKKADLADRVAEWLEKH